MVQGGARSKGTGVWDLAPAYGLSIASVELLAKGAVGPAYWESGAIWRGVREACEEWGESGGVRLASGLGMCHNTVARARISGS